MRTLMAQAVGGMRVLPKDSAPRTEVSVLIKKKTVREREEAYFEIVSHE